MRSIKAILLVVISCSLTQGAFPQSPAQKAGLSPAGSAPASVPEDEQAAQQKMSAILRLRGYVDRALRFRDAEARVCTLTALADTLWKYDEPSARQIFLQVDDILKSIKVSEAGKESPAEAKLTAGKLADLRDELISTLARHDATLARRLSASGPDAATDDRALTDQRAAMKLLVGGNSAGAVEFAERSLNGGVSQQMVGFLLQLRRRDERRADELYLQTLNRLVAEARVDGMRLMELGVYVFTSPFIDPAMEERGAMVIQSVGGVGVVNLSADRPGISPALIHAYLSAVAQVLSRPVSDVQQQKLYYAAGQQLLPKAQRFAPDLVPRIAAGMQSFISSVPAALTQDSAYEVLGPKKDYTFEDTLREIDEISDTTLHDLRCVMIANGLCFSEDFAHARTVAERIKDAAVRSRLINLVGSGEAHKTLNKGDVNAAEEMAYKLSPSIERAVLWLAIARARAKEGDRGRALEATNASLKDARGLNDARRPFVMLGAAGELAQLDAASAFQMFNEAVKLLNAGDGKLPKWSETIEVGGRSFPFSLRGGEVNAAGLVDSATRQLYLVNAQEIEAVVQRLEHELILGNALRALSESMMASLPSEKRLNKSGK
jgi:hypothetical protein